MTATNARKLLEVLCSGELHFYRRTRIHSHEREVEGNDLAKETKRILLVGTHNAFREALAVRLNQEEDLEVAWQAGSLADARGVHLDGVDVVIVDPLLPDGDGLVLIREVSVANPNAFALVVSHGLDPAMHHQALGAGALEVFAADASVEETINALRRSADAG